MRIISLKTLLKRHNPKQSGTLKGGNLKILPKPPPFATLHNLHVNVKTNKVEVKKGSLSLIQYELFLETYGNVLGAAEYNNTMASTQKQLDGIKVMMSSIGPIFAMDYTMLLLEKMTQNR